MSRVVFQAGNRAAQFMKDGVTKTLKDSAATSSSSTRQKQQHQARKFSSSAGGALDKAAATCDYKFKQAEESLRTILLPMKDVFRLKCTSRQWLSFISDSGFRNLYISEHVSSSPSFVYLPSILQLINEEEVPQTETNNFPPVRKLVFPGMKEGLAAQTLQIVSADKGFLLLQARIRENKLGIGITYRYSICNAVTKQWFTLPAHKFIIAPINFVGFITRVETGVVLTSYKVLLVAHPTRNKSFLEIQVFSSEFGEWSEYTVPFEFAHDFFGSLGNSVVVNNTLYWTISPRRVVAYDPYTDRLKFHVIEYPYDDDQNEIGYWCCYGCSVYQERLNYFENFAIIGYDKVLKIWEIGDNHQWQLKHTIKIKEDIPLPVSPGYHDCITLLPSFQPSDPDVLSLYAGESNSLVSSNIKTKEMEFLHVHECWPSGVHPLMGFFQVLPLWPISIPPSLMFSG
ncbi:OLC1v1021755C1 [Oldenlandia corymbosa var. corymbosa]|uniref:OLC1v1021755C1 n=1 Tax=Oldenlandia corymbosa var. corymbosa TaxID=529605 RepID=A0AAV1BWY8_OLDCO|nr:OLC1v1021755C1 [Oldenlandia corymbosa var. corymbosa]